MERNKTTKRILAFIFSLALVLSILGGKSDFSFVQAAKKVVISKKTVTLQVGKSLKLKVKGAKKKVKWSSNKKKVASVNAKGKVTAKTPGTAKIISKTSGRKFVCKVTVKPAKDVQPSIVASATPTVTMTPTVTASPKVTATISPTATPTVSPSAKPESYTFRTDDLFQSHYEKHGIEMGFATPEEYLAAANKVIFSSDALHKLEAEDGDHVYFMEATGEIVFLSTDGYIRTYFISDLDYYNRQ